MNLFHVFAITLSVMVSFLFRGCVKEPVVPQTGQVMFWVASDLGCGPTITVNCNGEIKLISKYYSGGTPSCDADGCATFSMAPGDYSFTAFCSGKNWSGTVTVTSGGCSTMQLTASGGGGGGGSTGIITGFNCSSVSNSGTLSTGVAASGVSSTIPYTGGNGGTYASQSVNSTGVTGLTATLSAGTLINGNGSVTYIINGTATSSGTANFFISLGGKSCTFSRTVNAGGNSGSVTDASGNTYPTVTIGTQVWMAENLRTTKYRDGSNIPVVTDNTQWANNFNTGATSPMMCWYNNDQATYTTNKFGALYNWYTINPATNGNKNVCPTGWHVPTDAEWTTLTTFLGGESVAGGKMKSTGTQYWISPNAGATNSSGWSGLPGGSRVSNGAFYFIGNYGTWWSSTEGSTTSAWGRNLGYGGGDVGRYDYNKASGFSVRCLRD
jgi:uncharacterized protein (TIGR02145 family)